MWSYKHIRVHLSKKKTKKTKQSTTLSLQVSCPEMYLYLKEDVSGCFSLTNNVTMNVYPPSVCPSATDPDPLCCSWDNHSHLSWPVVPESPTDTQWHCLLYHSRLWAFHTVSLSTAEAHFTPVLYYFLIRNMHFDQNTFVIYNCKLVRRYYHMTSYNKQKLNES